MIVIEENSSLEIRDCYMRSIRKDPQIIATSGNLEESKEAMNERLKKQIEC
jgi:hypothetical protein